SDLLFQALRLSTIGAEDFDGRVRDGIGYRLLAIATRPSESRRQTHSAASRLFYLRWLPPLVLPTQERKIGREMRAIGNLILLDLAKDRDDAIRLQIDQARPRPSAHAGIGMIEQDSERGPFGSHALQGFDDRLGKASYLRLTIDVVKFVVQSISQLSGKCESLDK